MTDEEINIEIAKARGWTFVDFRGTILCREPEWEAGRAKTLEAIPDYCNDRNDMMEAVKSLPYDQQAYYLKNLFYALIRVKGADGVSAFDTHTAEPKYCAEAYLKTFNLWKE